MKTYGRQKAPVPATAALQNTNEVTSAKITKRAGPLLGKHIHLERSRRQVKFQYLDILCGLEISRFRLHQEVKVRFLPP